jgi:hypothetical protein
MMSKWRRIALSIAALTSIGPIAAAPAASGAGPQAQQIYVRPFGPHAPWNIPLSGLPRLAQSDLYAALLWNAAPSDHPGNINLDFESYTYPVYYADATTRLYPIRTKKRTDIRGGQVPWDPAWRAAPGSDAQVIILDPDIGREWDLWQVSFDGETVHVSNGSLVPGDYRTKEDGNPPSRGIGIQYLAMLVRPQEIAQGKIGHALSMPIKNTSKDVYVAPATKLEGKGRSQEAIPEGTRFGLQVTDQEIEAWIRTLPSELPPATRQSARIIAQALRDYGWFITDNAGGAAFQFESRITAGDRWAELGLDERSIGYKQYPRDLLDGLLSQERIYAVVPSDQYPPGR